VELVKLVNERRIILSKLKGTTFKLIKKRYIVKKDGNRLGNKKFYELLNLYFRSLQLKMDMNVSYGVYASENPVLTRLSAHYPLISLTKLTVNVAKAYSQTIQVREVDVVNAFPEIDLVLKMVGGTISITDLSEAMCTPINGNENIDG